MVITSKNEASRVLKLSKRIGHRQLNPKIRSLGHPRESSYFNRNLASHPAVVRRAVASKGEIDILENRGDQPMLNVRP